MHAASHPNASLPTGFTRLNGCLSPAAERGVLLGALPGDESVAFSVTLPLGNVSELDTLLRRLYTPGDSLFRRYLTPEQFTERFGPTPRDYAVVEALLVDLGFTILDRHANRMAFEVQGRSVQVEQALHVKMLQRQDLDGRVFHTPDAEPAVPASLASRISGIVGLDDSSRPRPLHRRYALSESRAIIGTGPGGGLTPPDILTAYGLTSRPERGRQQVLGLVEFDGYAAADVADYENHYGLPHVPLQNVLLNGVTGVPGNAADEVTLDIELMTALAPSAAQILVYEGSRWVTILNRIASDNLAEEISISWGSPERLVSHDDQTAVDAALRQLAAQGQTIYASSGDCGDQQCTGAGCSGTCMTDVSFPASLQFITAVGGTTLATYGAGGAWTGETSWPNGGGGISTVWSLPDYQSHAVSDGSGGSSTRRNVPDVALDADPATGYSIRFQGQWWVYGGTSCSAPLWAAYTARVNERRAVAGRGPLGFANPTLYYAGQARSNGYHDIVSGSIGSYAAVRGFDNATGWGSFRGDTLSDELMDDVTVFYVDGGFVGTSDGSADHPYKTVGAAVAAAPTAHQSLIYIRSGTYPDTIDISKPVLIVNDGGGVVAIGK